MVIGVVLLAILAGVLAMLLLGGGSPGPSTEPTPSPTAGATQGVSASAVPSAGPSASAAAAPSAGPTDVALDTIVVTTVDGLSVRAEPGTGAERLGSLANGSPSFVAGGPADADGYRWYLVSGLGLPPNTGCAGPLENDPYNCPVWYGWVASGDTDGTPWLTKQPQECAKAPIDFEEIVFGVTDLMRLACFGSEPTTFRAWWPELPDEAEPGGVCLAQDAPSGWLVCQHTNDAMVAIYDADLAGIGLRISVDPASGVMMPERGTWLELTVHLDDPAAQSCGNDAVGAMAEEWMPEQWVLFCRGQLVVDAVTKVDGP
jgi:hypothetical protein